MKLTRFVSALLILVIVLLPAAVCVQAAFNPNEVYSSMVAMKSKYPEGMNWDNSNEYAWNGGIFAVGFGCAGFAFILSDAAFGDLPARMLTDFSYGDVRVGDIVRINGNTHSVIVLEKHTDHVIIAEGNFNHSIHWGRKLSRSVIESGTYVLTRYPEGVDTDPPKPVETVKPFTDVPVTQFYADAVRWAVDENITKGTSATKFSPNGGCTRGQVVTFLWRA